MRFLLCLSLSLLSSGSLSFFLSLFLNIDIHGLHLLDEKARLR
jgi:hypothetical protein